MDTLLKSVSIVHRLAESRLTMSIQDDQIAQLQAESALLAQALKALLEGRLDGPNSATWLLKALSPSEAAPVPAPFVFN